MASLRIICPNGHLGFAPLKVPSFRLGVEAAPDFIAADSGSDDIGPVPLGGRFWSAYFLDPFGTRLELATDRSGVRQRVVDSVLQTEAEARAELSTLFADPAEVERWLARMPLKRENATV